MRGDVNDFGDHLPDEGNPERGDTVLGLWPLGLEHLQKLLASGGSHARAELWLKANSGKTSPKPKSPKAKALI